MESGTAATFPPGHPGERARKRRFVDRGRRLVGATVALGLLGTLLISITPGLKLAYRSDEAHIAIETAASLVPALAALLFAGRALRGNSRTDLILAASLGVLASTNLFFSVLPSLTDGEPGLFATWAPVGGRLLGAIGFTAAALLPERQLTRPRMDLVRAFGSAALAVIAIAVIAALFADNLPQGVDPSLSPESANRPRIVGHWMVLSLQLATLLLYAAAATGFLRRAEHERDSLLLWVALAASLSAMARLNYFLFPSLYSEWVYVGDFLRLASYAALLVGLGRELLSYQRQAADAAVFEERRRVARELHDGLAQELAFIRSEGLRLSGTSDRGVMRMATAAERALGEARMAIAALTTPLGEPLDVTLRRAAEMVAGRVDARVELVCTGEPQLATATRQSIERIVREAASNAVRHGHAKRLRIEIEADRDVRVTIVDDGGGFDTDRAPSRESFGLISMRERAEAMGGTLTVRSAPGEGTTVEVVVANGQREPARAWRR